MKKSDTCTNGNLEILIGPSNNFRKPDSKIKQRMLSVSILESN